ncbi:hypothetical protein HK405_001544 [Cladochytrium tenue]|nr:hypothetical protein HK405_001544 [Cladochytrium tenue]
MVKLTTSDGQEFVVAKEIACQSVLIKNMLEDVGDADDQPIPLPNVSGPIMAKGAAKSAALAVLISFPHSPSTPLHPPAPLSNIRLRAIRCDRCFGSLVYRSLSRLKTLLSMVVKLNLHL